MKAKRAHESILSSLNKSRSQTECHLTWIMIHFSYRKTAATFGSDRGMLKALKPGITT